MGSKRAHYSGKPGGAETGRRRREPGRAARAAAGALDFRAVFLFAFACRNPPVAHRATAGAGGEVGIPLEKLSHYRLLDRLGSGGMGAVYRAEDTRLGRHVALKLLPPFHARDPQARARFLAEARAASALEHPHICMLFEFDEADGQPFIAMQLVDGETVKQALARGWLSEDRVAEIVGAIGSALAAAHARDIVHRDVKGENILLGRDGSIKLADFGIARLAENAGLTSASSIVGTPAYTAPEQVMGLRVGPAADQFSLAVVAYECLTGALPFTGGSMAAVFHAILNHEPAPPSQRRPGLAPGWDAVLARALSKLPERRYPDAAAFADAVREVAGAGRATGSFAAASASSPAAVTGTAAREARTLAALYFQNLSQDPENDYFCEGITEDLLADLSKVPGLRVASRNAVARYRGRSLNLQQVASELSVATVLEGGVRRSGNRVRITAQLVDARDGFQIWAERYDRTLEDVFAVQEDIANAIANALRGALTPDEAAEIGRGRPTAAEAYDLFLKGRDLYRRYTPADNAAARELFERAVALDPGYALAWAGIADTCAQVADKRWDTDPAWETRGFEAARRAIELDPRLPDGHKAEALLWRTRRDPERAMAALHRALEADPHYISALINLGQEMLSAGDFAGAESAIRRAVKVDPAYGFSHLMLSAVMLYTRRYEACLEAAHRAQSAGASPFYVAYAFPIRAHALALLGRLEAAEQEVVGGRAAGGPLPILRAAEALVAARRGESERARALVAQLEAERPAESLGCELAAAAASRLGLLAAATGFLRAAERIDQRHWAHWRLSPDLAAVRETPEFAACIGDRGRRLVWPLEAPALETEERARFASYEEASGLPPA